MPKIEPYVHECYGADGELYRTPVEANEVEYQMACHKCGNPLASPVQILAHIYRELTEI